MSTRGPHVPSLPAFISHKGLTSRRHVIGLTAPRSLSTSAWESWLKVSKAESEDSQGAFSSCTVLHQEVTAKQQDFIHKIAHNSLVANSQIPRFLKSLSERSKGSNYPNNCAGCELADMTEVK